MKKRKKYEESGFSKHLRETLEEDPEVQSLFFAEVQKLPEDSRRRVLRNLRLRGIRPPTSK